MNRSKRAITTSTRKKMRKNLRNVKSGTPSPETVKYGDEETSKELRKKFPKKPNRKKDNLIAAMRRRVDPRGESLSSKAKSEKEETLKGLRKTFKKNQETAKRNLITAMKKRLGDQKAKTKKHASKRTTPGSDHVDDFAPSYAQREGKRWLKTIIKQNLNNRMALEHKGRKK